jgi:hypothetical protein
MLLDSCIQLMSSSLKQDICGLHAPGTLLTNITSNQVDKCIHPELQYACLYWIQHLQKSGAQLYDNDDVHQFLKDHLLHWLEALGWMGKTSEGILAIISLEAQILVSHLYNILGNHTNLHKADKSPDLHAFIHDAKRFALYSRSVIELAPLQLYCSALVFAPEKSIVRRRFEKYVPLWLPKKSKLQANWNAALQTLEGHSDWVTSVAFSPNGKMVASGSHDRTVRLWDAVTGAALQTLEGHSEVTSVAFSPDGKMVASGSHDGTVRLWDAVTGAALQTLAVGASIGSTFPGSSEQSRALSVIKEWVTEDGERILWLPTDYRATCVAVWKELVVLGHSSGRISLLQFAQGLKLV